MLISYLRTRGTHLATRSLRTLRANHNVTTRGTYLATKSLQTLAANHNVTTSRVGL